MKSDDIFLMKPSCWRRFLRLVILSSPWFKNTCFLICKWNLLSLEKCPRTPTSLLSFEINCRTQRMFLHISASTFVSYSHNAYHSHCRFLWPSTAWLRYKQTAHNSTAFEPKQSVITAFTHKSSQLLAMTNSFKFQNRNESLHTEATQHRTSLSGVQEGGHHEWGFLSLFGPQTHEVTDSTLNPTKTTSFYILSPSSSIYYTAIRRYKSWKRLLKKKGRVN